ncbi:hypothetical protein K4F52_001871 [Lecanicillium sp. MT-2017a]|nr:hypothetical protein K4F52_001871 [Lecanicillium sp. MT-2017a]
MGYSLEGLVTSTIAAEMQLLPTVPLRQGLSLIPLPKNEQAHGDVTRQMADTFMQLSSKTYGLALRMSYNAPVAYLEAELFAAAGTQSAVVWRNGVVVLGPMIHDTDSGGLWADPDKPCASWPFNAALRLLGVQGEDVDEFDTIGLGQHRHTKDWIPAKPPSAQLPGAQGTAETGGFADSGSGQPTQ